MVLCMSTKIYRRVQVCQNENNPNTKTTHTSMVCWDSLFLDSDLGHSGFSAICHGDTPNNPLKFQVVFVTSVIARSNEHVSCNWFVNRVMKLRFQSTPDTLSNLFYTNYCVYLLSNNSNSV